MRYFNILFFLLAGNCVRANFITANSGNYTSFIGSLTAGDTLYLTPGTYTNGLTLSNKNGTAAQPIVIMGSKNLYTTIFQAQSGCNTVSLTKCSYIVIKNLQLDGMNLPVDAIKAEGTTGNYTHHITIEYCNIINHGNFVQIVGVNTKCSSWDWVIRKNRIIGAGTGLYLGGSSGDRPFVNGLIEYNYIANTLGYNMQIKHQTDTVRDDFSGTMVNGVTVIRHNVFCKELNGETGANARPNLLLGGFPTTGWGSTDHYEVYGNFFYQNPDEALFQGTGNIHFYDNVLVNHSDPSGFPAVAFQPHNAVNPQDIKVYHNTVWAKNSTAGIRMTSPNTSYQQYCYANAVFSANAVTGFTANNVDNVTDTYINAGNYVLSATTAISTLDLYPKSGTLFGSFTSATPFMNDIWYSNDFNGGLYNWGYRGAYSGCCTNPGWHLQLDTMPDTGSVPTGIHLVENEKYVMIYPNPAADELFISVADQSDPVTCTIIDMLGQPVYFQILDKRLDVSFLSPGFYQITFSDRKGSIYGSKMLIISR